ncbi:MAG TPA: S-layer homology domain-containing protein, partial [Thermoanaerobaculia bacterium]|nr:S-layer homology domain-containing protein [Thermoanaerobaculia bacterium]
MNRAAGCMTLALSLALPGLAPAEEIEEVLAGAFGRPDIQFVEIEADCRFVQWGGLARLTFYDRADALTAEYFFPAAPSPCSGPLPVLVGTQAFADLPSAPDPDFLMPPLLTPGSGKVCFHATGLRSTCLSYGGFEGDLPFQESPAPYNAPELSALGICSLQGVGGTRTNADYDLLPPSPVNARLQAGSVAVPPRFRDVPAASPFQPFAEALFNAGVTGGCGGGNFCPGSAVTREQMAVFFLLAAEGPAFQPPACSAPLFGDVPCSHPFARWINELARRGISGG